MTHLQERAKAQNLQDLDALQAVLGGVDLACVHATKINIAGAILDAVLDALLDAVLDALLDAVIDDVTDAFMALS